jgi:hypothetical protein
MDIEGAREALRKVPFKPLTMRLADGRALPITHPEFVALGKRRLVAIGEDDSWSIVSLDEEKKPRSGGNGHKKR